MKRPADQTEIDKLTAGAWELPRNTGAVLSGEDITPLSTFAKAVPKQGFEYRFARDPQLYIYLFNISERTHAGFGEGIINAKGIEIPGLRVPGLGGKSAVQTLPDLPDNPFRLYGRFPHPMLFKKDNFDSNQYDLVEVDGFQHVVSLISPALGMAGARSLDQQVDENTNLMSQNKNYARSGVFFDVTPIPSSVELLKAYKRMETYFDALLEKARVGYLSDKAKFQLELKSNADYNYAADYRGVTTEWHQKAVRMVECERCGERKKSGVKFHRTEFGGLCVEPTQDGWREVYRMGLVSKDNIPEDFHWWNNESEGKKSK